MCTYYDYDEEGCIGGPMTVEDFIRSKHLPLTTFTPYDFNSLKYDVNEKSKSISFRGLTIDETLETLFTFDRQTNMYILNDITQRNKRARKGRYRENEH